jgi:1,4-dihydroxy-2-naphthoate octaprenyltransferase
MLLLHLLELDLQMRYHITLEGLVGNNIGIWFKETRPQFLVLTFVLIFLGTTVAWFDGFFNTFDLILSLVGLLLLHISVNVLNDYFDYKSGLDQQAVRTPFSGGSGILPAKLLDPGAVLTFGIICFWLAVPIGVYFVLAKGWLLLPLLAAGAICVLLYTPRIAKLGWGMSEIAAGLGMGTLPVLGAYFVQTETYTWHALIAAVPSGILVANLLLLNEFPDVEADRNVGRKTMPIMLGKDMASKIYIALTVIMYAWIIVWAAVNVLPWFVAIGLLTLPLALQAVRGAFHYEVESKLIPALGANISVILGTQALMAIGYIVATVV